MHRRRKVMAEEGQRVGMPECVVPRAAVLHVTRGSTKGSVSSGAVRARAVWWW